MSVPTAPTLISAVVTPGEFITLTWGAVAGVTSYTVYQSISGGPVISTSVAPSFTVYEASGLLNGVYSFYVTASNGSGESLPSSTLTATMISASTTTPAPPITPSITSHTERAMYIPAYGENCLSIYDTTTLGLLMLISVGVSPGSIAISPTGSFVYVANSGSNTVSVVNTATYAVTNTIAVGHTPNGIVVTPDGYHAYVTNNGDGTVSCIDLRTFGVVTITIGTDPYGIAITPSGAKIYVTNRGSSNVSVISTATNTVTATVSVGTYPTGISISPDGTKAYVSASGPNTIQIILTATDAAPVTSFTSVTDPIGSVVSADNSTLYVANYTTNTVSVINASSGTLVTAIPVGSCPTGLVLNGSLLYCCNYADNSISIIDTSSNEVTDLLPTQVGPLMLVLGTLPTTTSTTTPVPTTTPPLVTTTAAPTTTTPVPATTTTLPPTTTTPVPLAVTYPSYPTAGSSPSTPSAPIDISGTIPASYTPCTNTGLPIPKIGVVSGARWRGPRSSVPFLQLIESLIADTLSILLRARQINPCPKLTTIPSAAQNLNPDVLVLQTMSDTYQYYVIQLESLRNQINFLVEMPLA